MVDLLATVEVSGEAGWVCAAGHSEQRWWPAAERGVRAPGIMVLAPALDDDPSLGEAVEHSTVQGLVAKPGVEALAVAVFPRRAWLDEVRFGADRYDPIPHRLGDELGTVVRTNMPRHAAQDEESLAPQGWSLSTHPADHPPPTRQSTLRCQDNARNRYPD